MRAIRHAQSAVARAMSKFAPHHNLASQAMSAWDPKWHRQEQSPKCQCHKHTFITDPANLEWTKCPMHSTFRLRSLFPTQQAVAQTAPELSGHCGTSNRSARSQWALPDLNASTRSQWALPDLNTCQRECQSRCQIEWHNRMSDKMPDRMLEHIYTR